MSGLNWKAVLVGIVVDFVGTLAVGFVAAVIAIATGPGLDGPPPQFDEPPVLAALLVVGLALTSFGAFIAARMAGVEHIKHGLAVGVAMLLLGFLLIPFGGMPLWYDVLSILLIVPAGWVGGYLAAGMARAPARS